MYCGLLQTANTTPQTIAQNGLLSFNSNIPTSTIGVYHSEGSTTVSVPLKGVYEIELCADIEPDGAGNVTVNILNNSTVIGTTTFSGTADEATHIAMSCLTEIKGSCPLVNNSGNITVQIGSAATVTNAYLIVKKVR